MPFRTAKTQFLLPDISLDRRDEHTAPVSTCYGIIFMMTKAPINADKIVIAGKDTQPVMLLVLAWIALSGLFLAAWFLMAYLVPLGFLGGVIGAIAAFLIVILGEYALRNFPIKAKLRYQLAFALSAGGISVLWLLNWSALTFWMVLINLCLAWLGALFGGLFLTGRGARMWENNSPPSTEVMTEVCQRHLDIIGVPAPEPVSIRVFDILLAGFGLLLSAPVWLACSLLIWLEDPGPLLFVKNSVGKGGVNFHQFKLRTMVSGAEEHTGPVLASEDDERVLWSGRLLRKTALDELPQLLNILIGEMSFVGPRPQRTVLVRGYLDRIPAYAERHRVLPGLAGLAQVAGDYYLTPLQKLRFDRLYIRYRSLGYNIKLIALAFVITFWYRWHRRWDGHLPRWMIRFGSPKP